MKCPKCGMELEQGQRFCSKCGAPAPHTPKLKTILTAVILITFLLLAVLTGIGFISLLADSDTDFDGDANSNFAPAADVSQTADISDHTKSESSRAASSETISETASVNECSHDWQKATCTTPETCSICGQTRGEPAEHVAGEWCEIRAASLDNFGIRILECVNCGMEMDREYIEEESAQTVDSYKDSCYSYSYDDLARYPEYYKGEHIHLYGEVSQVVENGNDIILLVDVTYDEYWWKDPVYVSYTRQDINEARVLEYDKIEIWGEYLGLTSYQSVLGSTNTVPSMTAEYIEIVY